MTKRSVLGTKLALVLAALFSLALPQDASAQDKAAKIDELMSAYQRYRLFNGSVLVAESGKAIYKKSFGLANMEWNIPNQPDTKFRFGSITKQFTSMLVLQLVEQGKMQLDGKLSDYLPFYPKKVGERVTIHHLLNHTSGIPTYTGLPGFIANLSRDPYTPDELIKKFIADKELEFEPGKKYSYNNSGYFLLGAIVEKVAGEPYEKVLQRQILDPLGMKNTGYDHWETVLDKRATGYERTLTGYRTAPYLDMSIPYAAGSLYSTVEDLYLWDQALYTDKLLSPKWKALMFQPGLDNYAYGWVVQKVSEKEPGAGSTMVSHGGGINGFNTLIVRLVDQKHLVVLFNNTGGTRLGEMALGIRAILFGQQPAAPKRPLAEALYKVLSEKGAGAAVEQYREWKKKEPEAYDFREGELNRLGYELLRSKRVKDAIEVFQLNVEAYPKSSNVYDSLAEAQAEAGEHESAIKNYAKALELNPKSTRAIEALNKLREKMK